MMKRRRGAETSPESQDYKRKVNMDRTEKQTASSPTCKVVKEKKDKQRESLADSHVNF